MDWQQHDDFSSGDIDGRCACFDARVCVFAFHFYRQETRSVKSPHHTDVPVAAQNLQHPDLWMLPLGVKSFESNMSTEWGLNGAASLIVMLPVVALFLLLSRWLVSGPTLGSMKG